MATDGELLQGGGQPGPGPAPRPAHHLLQRDRAPGVQDGGGAVIQRPGHSVQSHSVQQHIFRGPGSRLIECGAEFLAIVFVSLYLCIYRSSICFVIEFPEINIFCSAFQIFKYMAQDPNRH